MIDFRSRSDRNRWWLVGGLYLAGYLVVAVAIGICDSLLLADRSAAAVIYGGILLVTALLVVITRGLTKARTWWLLPLLVSPASVTVGMILLLNLLMYLGVAHH